MLSENVQRQNTKPASIRGISNRYRLMITIYNTLTAQKEQFTSLDPHKVKLYVCGITPYDYAHIGHGRSYVAFDLLYRLLVFLKYDVIYVRNFTDIDDKLLKKAKDQFGDQFRYPELAQKFIDAYNKEMSALNCVVPRYQPRVTENMDDIIKFIQELVDLNNAYVVNGDVYFRISSFHEYGKLSKQKIEELRAGARVDVNERKEDLLDFALWKSESMKTFWKSPWGWGRPGWHIECSALAKKYLGKKIDIHGGGADLIFPHHENEIAQSEVLYGPPFARYWMHNGLVRIDQEKMSKSLGNVFMLKDMFQKVNPMILRFYFLNHHYRTPLDFSFKELEIAKKNYQKICKAFAKVEHRDITTDRMQLDSCVQQMLEFLKDDLNSTGMMGLLFDYLHTITDNRERARAVKAFLTNVLGLHLEPLQEQEVEYTPEIKLLIKEREQARTEKDWKAADKLRKKLCELGVKIQDTKLE